jgi:hypothetical protein
MNERRAGDRDSEIAHISEVGQPLYARQMLLGKEDLLARSLECAPLADASFERASHAVGELVRMGFLQSDKQRNSLQLRRATQQWHHLSLPDLGKRVAARAPTALRALRGKRATAFDAPSGARTHARLRCGNFLSVIFTCAHIEADLLVRDSGSGHGCSLLLECDQPSYDPATPARRWLRISSGYAAFDASPSAKNIVNRPDKIIVAEHNTQALDLGIWHPIEFEQAKQLA